MRRRQTLEAKATWISKADLGGLRGLWGGGARGPGEGRCQHCKQAGLPFRLDRPGCQLSLNAA